MTCSWCSMNCSCLLLVAGNNHPTSAEIVTKVLFVGGHNEFCRQPSHSHWQRVKTWFHRKYFRWRQLSPICSQLTAPTGSLQKMDIFSIFCIKCHIKSISDMSYQKWSLLHVYWMIWGTNRCIYIYCWAILQTYFQSEISFKSQKYPLTDSVGNDVADGVARLHVVHGDRHHPLLLSHCLLIRLWGGLNKTQF